MTTAIVFAVALVVAWPALPWLELAVTGPRTGASTEASMSDWVPSAEAQGKRRRRGKSRRRSRRPAQQAPSQEAPAPAPAAGTRPAAAAAEPAAQTGKGGKDKDQVFDFTGLDLAGQLRTPQLLYFLDRAAEELQRASLERRSFLPEMVRSIDEESL